LGPRDAHDLGPDNLELDRPRKRDRLVEAGVEGSSRDLGAADGSGLRRRMNDEGATGRRGR
jgi:hypothetical protein